MTNSALTPIFNRAASEASEKAKHPPPFSIRFTDEERARLDYEAGVLSLAAYIRLRLFSDMPEPPPARRKQTRKVRSPSAELAVLGNMLGALAKSRIPSNLNQIAKAANMGALPVTPELEEELFEACAAVKQVRQALIEAMGVKAQ